MNNRLYPRLALRSMITNRQFYLPYILSVMGASAGFYILLAINGARDLPERLRYVYLTSFTGIGCAVIGLFSVIFLFYTNSFLMKRRMKEIGLYNILGMGKRHIARMLVWETGFTAIAGIGLGVGCGLLLQKLMTLFLGRLMHVGDIYAFYVSTPGIALTAALFGAILFLNLLVNLLRLRLQNPIELLRGSSAGEKEPKSRILLALLGVVTLGAAYWIAVSTNDAMSALQMYFIAVFLVIAGTYLLFTAVSISILRLLRSNKRFYYRTSHFIGVSGMLYRMKRNALGLANICILSTMVLVMASGTLSLYAGTGDMLDKRYPADIVVDVLSFGRDGAADAPMAFFDEVDALFRERGRAVSGRRVVRSLQFNAWLKEDGRLDIEHGGTDALFTPLTFITAEDYAALSESEAVPLGEGEALVWGAPLPEDALTVSFRTDLNPDGEAVTLRVVQWLKERPLSSRYIAGASNEYYVVVPDADALNALYAAQYAAFGEDYASNMHHAGLYDIDGTDEEQVACEEAVYDRFSDWLRGREDRCGIMTESRASEARFYYALNGGFFFLGMFLSLLFILATAMIIYYKQVSEGYEDAGRFDIMRQVGLSRAQIRRSINAQMRIVFFAPLLAAAVHVAFDYKLMVQLLSLFELNNVLLTLQCTGVCLLLFFAVYGLVYLLTARVYYRIVAPADRKAPA